MEKDEHIILFLALYTNFYIDKRTEKYTLLLQACGCDHIRMNIGKKKYQIKLKLEKEQIKIKN